MNLHADSTGPVIAVDGPSGSGKSTVSRTVATELGLRYFDTGATYRALTWWLLQRGTDPEAAGTIEALVESSQLPDIAVVTDPAAPAITVDGVNVEPAIRGPEVTRAVSAVSAVPAVRTFLVAYQRAVIGAGGIVVEGRDIGSVVAPDAAVKIFLTAAVDARAQRRAAETAGANASETRGDLERRDSIDSNRKVAPLLQAGDAHVVDSTWDDLPQVVATVLGIVRRSLAERGQEQAPGASGPTPPQHNSGDGDVTAAGSKRDLPPTTSGRSSGPVVLNTAVAADIS